MKNSCNSPKLDINSADYAENVQSISHKFAAIRTGKWRHKELNSPSVTVLRAGQSAAAIKQVKPL